MSKNDRSFMSFSRKNRATRSLIAGGFCAALALSSLSPSSPAVAATQVKTGVSGEAVGLPLVGGIPSQSSATNLLPTPPAASPAAVVKAWGEPTWSDEFNGGTSKWNVRNGDSLSYDKARILSRNVTTYNGKLHITAKRETVAGRDFTTGYLDTIGKYEQKYGRWEIRAKIPTTKGVSRGVWPAFWLRNKSVGEIDIMEAWGDPFTNPTRVGTSSLTVHESTNGGANRKGWNWEAQAGVTEHSSLRFHTWAIEYSPTQLKGYFDGKQVVTATKKDHPWLWGPNFQSPLNMRLNLQIGSPYHGYPVGPNYKDTKMPATFMVDYVRAWKLPGT